MDTISLEQYKELRRQGLSQEQIKDLQKRGKIAETVKPKETFMQKGLLRSAGSFLGMEEFGRGIGQTIYNLTGEGKKVQESILQQQQQTTTDVINALKKAREEGNTQAVANLSKTLERMSTEQGVDFEQLGTGGLSNREVIGSAIQTGLTFGSLLGAGPTAQGVGKVTGLTGGTVKQAIARGAGAGAIGGAAFGGAEAITEGQAVAPAMLKGAAFGAATGGVISGVGQYISNLAKITPGDKLLEQTDAMKTLQKQFDKNTVYRRGADGTKEIISDPISTIVKAGAKPKVVNGKIDTQGARDTLRGLINQADDQVQASIQNAEVASTPLATLKQTVVDSVKANPDFKAGGKVTKVLSQIDNYFDDFATSYGDDIATTDISAIRAAMNKSFNADTVDVERAIGDAARKVLYKNAPGARELLVREGQLIAADKFLDALHGRAVKGGRLGGYFANLIGAIIGQQGDTPFGLGPVVGALGVGKLQQVMQKSALDPLTPKIARGLTAAFEALPTDTAGNVSKTAILSLIAQLSNQPSQQESVE